MKSASLFSDLETAHYLCTAFNLLALGKGTRSSILPLPIMSTTTVPRNRVILIYNADGTVMGKLRYAWKKLSQSADKGDSPACGNCDVTHGGLSLSETDAWLRAKAELQKALNVDVLQLHRDELDDAQRAFVKQHGVRFPSVLYHDRSSGLREIVPSGQINACARTSPSLDAKALQEQRAVMLVDAIRSSLQTSSSDNARL